MKDSREMRESEELENKGIDEVRFTKEHEHRLDAIEKHLGIGKHVKIPKSPMERMKERKRHT